MVRMIISDESANERMLIVWMSKLVPMKVHNILQVCSSNQCSKLRPTVMYVQIEYSEQGKVSSV